MLTLWLGATPIMTLIVLIAIMAIAQCMRVRIVHDQIGLSYSDYCKTVILPIMKVIIVALPLYWVVSEWTLPGLWIGALCKVAVAGIFGITVAFLLGLNSSDRHTIMNLVGSRLTRRP